MYNKQTVLGNVGKKPELRFSANQQAFMEVSVGTSRSWKNNDTQKWKSKTTWHKLMFSGKQAESAVKKIDKGTTLFAEGPTIDDQWVDKYKQNRVTKAVRVETYRIIPREKSSEMDNGMDNNMSPMTPEEADDWYNS